MGLQWLARAFLVGRLRVGEDMQWYSPMWSVYLRVPSRCCVRECEGICLKSESSSTTVLQLLAVWGA